MADPGLWKGAHLMLPSWFFLCAIDGSHAKNPTRMKYFGGKKRGARCARPGPAYMAHLFTEALTTLAALSELAWRHENSSGLLAARCARKTGAEVHSAAAGAHTSAVCCRQSVRSGGVWFSVSALL